MAPGEVNFWPQDYNENNFSKGPQDKAKYQIAVNFWPQDYNENNFSKGPQDKAKYQMAKAKAF